MDNQENAYLFFRENKLFKFIYIKLQPIDMVKALPITYNDNSGCYLSAVFDPDGRDFLSQSNESDILNMIKDNDMISILDKEYQQLPDYFIEKIDITKFNHCKSFMKKQLNH